MLNTSHFWKLKLSTQPKICSLHKWLMIHQLILQFFYVSTLSQTLLYSVLWRRVGLESRKVLGWGYSNTLGRLVYTSDRIPKFSKLNTLKSLPKLNHKLKLNSTSSVWPLFIQNWTLFRPKGTLIYHTNRDFRLMFLADSASKSPNTLVGATRYLSRWLDSFNLMYNLLYVESQVQLLSNKFFIEEALVFNWSYNRRNYKLFKYVQPFFTFKDAPHGAYVHSAILGILLQRLDLAIIVDLRNHLKLLGYLQKYGLFSIGLVPINYSPWRVSYPVPVFSDSPITQYYFIRLLFFIRSSATSQRYTAKRELLQSYSLERRSK